MKTNVIDKVPTIFKCPFCNHEKAIEAQMKHKEGTAALSCRVCGATYSCGITFLDEPVDVFCQWIDQCEEAAAQEAAETGEPGASASAPAAAVGNDGFAT